MSRLLLVGSDAVMLLLLERIRLHGGHEVVGLGPAESGSLMGVYAEIAGLPLLDERDAAGWAESADLIVAGEGAGGLLLPDLPRVDADEAEARLLGEPVAAPPEPPRGAGARVERPLPVRSADTVPAAPAEERAADAPATPAGEAPPAGGAAPDAGERETTRAEPRRGITVRRDPTAFPRELQREILRSKRYHLGFCLTVLRVLDAAGRTMSADRFRTEPLASLPQRVGRATDSWGLTVEGYLLHLAPETIEQAAQLRRRLVEVLNAECADLPGGPWRTFAGQARYPQHGEDARGLLTAALRSLERSLATARETEP
ncbi:MAG: hypothetical protein JW819_11205 [Candidatus Krumholzibacteriota bacterium]|nr:hypothetical protein [Candidatus Krumholzibacteriota bacterium]